MGNNRIKPKSLSLISKQLVGTPYELGGLTDNGMDCFSLILKYLEMRGIEIPESYKGITTDNYAQKYKENLVQAKELMVDFLKDLLVEVPLGQMLAGDILLLKMKHTTNIFLAILGGNGHIIGSSKALGVSVTPLHYYSILGVFKCRKHYQ